MHFELISTTAHADVVKVETLMAELGVNLYDLETIGHVRDVLDKDGEDPFSNLTEAQAFTLVGQKIDHNALAHEYEFIINAQRDLVSDALEDHLVSTDDL